MATRRPPESESTERNAPSVEAAFQAAPAELVAEILDGELQLSPHPARPTINGHSNTSEHMYCSLVSAHTRVGAHHAQGAP